MEKSKVLSKSTLIKFFILLVLSPFLFIAFSWAAIFSYNAMEPFMPCCKAAIPAQIAMFMPALLLTLVISFIIAAASFRLRKEKLFRKPLLNRAAAAFALCIVLSLATVLILSLPVSILVGAGCTGFSQLPIKSQYLSGTAVGSIYTIIFTNMTGQNLTNASVTASCCLNGTASIGDVPANAGRTAVFTLDADDTFAPNKENLVRLILTYTDAEGTERTANASCKPFSPN
ncbi:MAG: hypothetical protein V1676_02795 [Candidatus Diapherotrites archaeon]